MGCWCAASLAIATAQQVEFPLEFYSFAEIAQRMSIEGRRIECARDLRQRLALIHLKPRSWQQTRELLEKALDVRFRKISDAENRWILERNPEVVRVERQRRERLASHLDKEGFAELRLMQIFLDKNISPEKVLEMAQELHPDFTVPEKHRKGMLQLVELMRALPLENALRSWRAHKRLNQRFMNAMRSDDAEPALTEQSLAEFGFSAAELQWAEQAAQSKDEKWQLLLGSRSESESLAQRKAQALFSLGMFAEGYLATYFVSTLLPRLQPPLRARDAIEQGVVARLYDLTLPPELAAWFLNDFNGDQIPLSATDPVPMRLLSTAHWGQFGYDYHLNIQPLDLERTEENTLSFLPQLRKSLALSPESAQKAFQRFDPDLAQAYQAAYECHKQLLQDPSVRAPLDSTARTLARMLYEWAQKHQAELIAEVYPEPFDSRGKTLADWLEKSGDPYLLERHDTVWVVRHWAAFVQRVPDLPLTALRNLLRTKGEYADWRAFYQAITPEQARWLLVRVSGFCHPPEVTRLSNQEVYPTIDEFGKAWLFTIVLEQLPPALRSQLWDYTNEQKPLTVALATLPPNARVQLTQILSQWRAALGVDQSRRLFTEDPAALVEQLVLYRTGTGWMLSLPESPSDHTRFSFDKSLVFSLAPCSLPLKDDTPPEVIFHRR